MIKLVDTADTADKSHGNNAAVGMLINALNKGFKFSLCIETPDSTACLHNLETSKDCARLLERFARRERGMPGQRED